MSAAVSHDIDVANVLQETLSLPLPERSYIAERLLMSLDEEGELSPAWRQELDERVQRREKGETNSWSREEVHQQMRAILTKCD